MIVDLGRLTAGDGASVKEVMRTIDRNGMGIALIVDAGGRFAGMVTDGDIRRAILRGVSIDSPVAGVMKKDAVRLTRGNEETEIHSLLSRDDVRKRMPLHGPMKVPVVDSNGKLVGLEFVQRGPLGARAMASAPAKDSVKRVLVIGGAGYLGSVLVRKLLAKGYAVRVLDNLTYGDDGLRALSGTERFELVKGDIRDLKIVMDATKGMDAVIHLAAIVGDPACALSPEDTIMVNHLATKMVAEVCKYHQINRFIFASTCSVYGANRHPDEPITEESPLNPLSLYAEMKLRSEQGILELLDENFSPVILRMATLYGYSPRMRFDLVVNIFTAKAVKGEPMKVFGGNQWRPNLHVEDAADAYIRCLESDITKVRGKVLNVGSDTQNYRIMELAEMIHGLVPGSKIEVSETGDPRDYKVSFAAISSLLGYKVVRDIPFAVKEIGDAFKSGEVADYSDRKFSNYQYLKGEWAE